MNGRIFDIQRFSLHDGPGIRTTVFLKGCPLQCAWCCNPESQSAAFELAFDANKCTACGNCINECSQQVFVLKNGTLQVERTRCNACEGCLKSCETQALKIYGSQSDVGEVIEEVLKDKAYYETSGGGLTISGGECMMQPKFVLNLLKKAKAHNIHTCIETCGLAKQKNYEQIFPYTDLFLFDFKITDDSLHQHYTGQSNRLILSNLRFLSSMGADIILRCPIVPNINDTIAHFNNIAMLYHELNIQHIEVMPYHNFGAHKYTQLGLPKPDLPTKAVGQELADHWRSLLIEKGCALLPKP